MRNLVLALISIFLFAGCSLSQKKQFEHVQVGMDKGEVLGLLESPQRTQRWHGMDRWTYIFYDENQRQEKEVHFQEGRANYVGDVYVPAVSADQQDKLNEASNREMESQLQARKEEFKRNYHNYEEQTPTGRDSIRYVPQFQPVQ